MPTSTSWPDPRSRRAMRAAVRASLERSLRGLDAALVAPLRARAGRSSSSRPACSASCRGRRCRRCAVGPSRRARRRRSGCRRPARRASAGDRCVVALAGPGPGPRRRRGRGAVAAVWRGPARARTVVGRSRHERRVPRRDGVAVVAARRRPRRAPAGEPAVLLRPDGRRPGVRPRTRPPRPRARARRAVGLRGRAGDDPARATRRSGWPACCSTWAPAASSPASPGSGTTSPTRRWRPTTPAGRRRRLADRAGRGAGRGRRRRHAAVRHFGAAWRRRRPHGAGFGPARAVA